VNCEEGVWLGGEGIERMRLRMKGLLIGLVWLVGWINWGLGLGILGLLG